LKHIRNLPKTSNKSLCDEKTLAINAKYEIEEKSVSLIEEVMAIGEPMEQADQVNIVNIEPDVNVNYEGETMVNIFE
jgi:Asp-tRNA(Asn)/Glu-tRNA(Gln) amidotransferase C subunit